MAVRKSNAFHRNASVKIMQINNKINIYDIINFWFFGLILAVL